ncbi:MAG: STM4012 family radical SAM protein [Myxococcota bacterium]
MRYGPRMLQGSLYQGYLYSYPHKLAYRALPPRTLRDVWRVEERKALSLYAHVPFCEMRCGFCNLFTTAQPPTPLVDRWLDAWERALHATIDALPDATFTDFAIGGGTPTWLSVEELSRVLDGFARFGADLKAIPGSVEVSPTTVTSEHAAMLVERGVTRLSMGIQSLDAQEVAAVLRPQAESDVAAAVRAMQDAKIENLNLDLMYGLPGQSTASFVDSIDRILDWQPEEIFLYPLYVRPKTGLFRHGGSAEDEARLALYRAGRDRLLEAGYEQRSMRLFASPTATSNPSDFADPDRNLVGVGVGARSYTSSLHFSSRYAVRNAGVRAILDAWMAADPAAVDWGIALTTAERRRRAVILRLLDARGIDRAVHGSDPFDEVPALTQLLDHELATWDGQVLRLTAAGLERSDQIGPWLISTDIRGRMNAAEVQ